MDVLIKVLYIDDMYLLVEYVVEVGVNFSKIFNGDEYVSNVGFIFGMIGCVFY